LTTVLDLQPQDTSVAADLPDGIGRLRIHRQRAAALSPAEAPK
jgi:hypothetical protein